MNGNVICDQHSDGSNHNEDRMQGHWVLASLGKKVLRPGGIELTRKLLDNLRLAGADVVEFAPGMGRTAKEIAATGPRSYVGVDANPAAAEAVRGVISGLGSLGKVVVADAACTGLPDASADVVIGEAMLTMQSDRVKEAIVAEAARILRPGGRYGIHEMGLQPEDMPEAYKTEIRQALARNVRTNVRPQTVKEWTSLLEGAGFVVTEVATTPMALLQIKRFISDEGFIGLLRFAKNMLIRPQARKRVLGMRRTFKKYAGSINAVALVATKPLTSTTQDTKEADKRKDHGGACCVCACAGR